MANLKHLALNLKFIYFLMKRLDVLRMSESRKEKKWVEFLLRLESCCLSNCLLESFCLPAAVTATYNLFLLYTKINVLKKKKATFP